MKRYFVTAVLSMVFLIGSLYPKLLLSDNLRLVDERGKRVRVEQIDPDIPLELHFGYFGFLLE